MRLCGCVAVLLSLLLGLSSANGMPPESPAGTEVPELRTECSKTYSIGQGQFQTQIYSKPVHRLDQNGRWQPLETDIAEDCYPDVAPYWTGNVSVESNAYYKNDDLIWLRGAQSASFDRHQAWAKFNLSPIPDNAMINWVIFYCFCTAVGTPPQSAIHWLTSDPVPMAPQPLYNAIENGVEVAPPGGSWVAGLWYSRALTSVGRDSIQARLGVNWAALGLWQNDPHISYYAYATGYTGGGYIPYLTLDYTLAPDIDISVEEIISPVGYVPVSGTVTPTATWRNNQAEPTTFQAWFFLINPLGQRVYSRVDTVWYFGGYKDTTLSFLSYNVGAQVGIWTARCSTYAAGDINANNDVLEQTFEVTQAIPGADVGVADIIAPTMWVDTCTVVTPTARWHNFHNQPVNFTAYFFLADTSGARVYTDNIGVAGLGAGCDTVLQFRGHDVGTVVGRWSTRCSTHAPGDTMPGNDFLDGVFHVRPGGNPGWPYGWSETRSHVPEIPTNKPVKQGGWLAHNGTSDAGEAIYVHKGYKTTDFYAYYPDGDSWKTLTGMPYSKHPNEKWAKKPPYKGSKGIQVGDVIYVTQGNNTLGFWSYHIMGDTWHTELDVPLGPDRKKIKGGADLTYVPGIMGGPGHVYLLKGYRCEFYRFNLETKEWSVPLTQIPHGARAKVDKGSWIVYNCGETGGQDLIYTFKSKYNELYAYHIFGDSFSAKAQMPMEGWHSGKMKPKKAKDGGCASYWNGSIYALKGGNTQQFWKYFPSRDSWVELETLPNNGSTGKKKRVKYGADIVAYGGCAFFALKGNKTREVWRYVESFGAADAEARDGVAAGASMSARPGIRITPNPLTGRYAAVSYSVPRTGPVTVRLFDVTGSVVRRQTVLGRRNGVVNLDLQGLSAGAYLVRLDTDQAHTTWKLVVQR